MCSQPPTANRHHLQQVGARFIVHSFDGGRGEATPLPPASGRAKHPCLATADQGWSALPCFAAVHHASSSPTRPLVVLPLPPPLHLCTGAPLRFAPLHAFSLPTCQLVNLPASCPLRTTGQPFNRSTIGPRLRCVCFAAVHHASRSPPASRPPYTPYSILYTPLKVGATLSRPTLTPH